MAEEKRMDKIVALCKRRGFLFQSSEIYGGINGFWDYGPLGVELKNNIKDAWWHDMVRNPPPGPDGQEIQMVGVDCSIIMNPQVWVASGHVGGFQDPMSSCKFCRRLFRDDQVWDQIVTSPWLASLRELNDKNPEGVSGVELRRWAQNKGKKLVPNLAMVRNPEVALGWMGLGPGWPAVWRFDDPKDSHFSDAKTSLSYLATEQWADGRLITPCPVCGGDLTEPRAFNLMFETHCGALKDAASLAYLRPETAQGIFVNFRNVLDSTRLKLPFGIAQVGKAFRNEINPRNYTFRSREFEQMEIEFFCRPSESMKWYEYWRDVRIKWYTQLGIKSDRLRPREQTPEERAHYSVGTTDIEYLFPFSEEPQELEGVAHRSDYDLKAHMQHSGRPFKDDKKRREEEKKKLEQQEKPRFSFVPHVIEPSAGADRFTLAVLCEAYDEDTVGGEARTVMRFHPRLAPIKAAVFPLVNKEGMPEIAQRLYRELKKRLNVVYDDKGAVGRRYRRQDEAGTPFCITIDGDTLKDQTVTIRERDSTKQRRIPISAVADELHKLLEPGA